MRIFKVTTENTRYKQSNWASYTISARSCEEAIRKIKREFHSGERALEVTLLADAEY